MFVINFCLTWFSLFPIRISSALLSSVISFMKTLFAFTEFLGESGMVVFQDNML